MYNGKTTSLKQVLWKVKNNSLTSDITYEQAGEFAIEGLRLLGAPLLYKDVVSAPIEVQDYKAVVPSNYLFIRQIRALVNNDDPDWRTIPLTYATDTFHPSFACMSESSEDTIELTYTVQGGIVTTSFNEGYIQISYKALQVDDEGFPLIPDDQDTLLALEYYIVFRYLEPIWLVGKITDKAFEYIQQKKSWYMGAANTSLTLQGIDHLEAAMATINRLVMTSTAQSYYYKGQGKRERIKKYN